MKNVLIAISVYALMFFAEDSFAQGLFLDKGQSGVLIGANVLMNEEASGFTAGIGYSVNGVVDFGMDVGKMSSDDPEAESFLLSPSLRAFILKQTAKIPISFALNAVYEHQDYSGDNLDDLGLDMTGSATALGGCVYKTFPSSPTVDVIISGQMSFISAKTETVDQSGYSEEYDDDWIDWGLGIKFAFELKTKSKVVLSAKLVDGNDRTSYVFGFGYLLPMKKSK